MTFLETESINKAAQTLLDAIEAVCHSKKLRLKSFAILAVAGGDDGDKIGCIESGCECSDCTSNMIEIFADARGATVERSDDDSSCDAQPVLHS